MGLHLKEHLCFNVSRDSLKYEKRQDSDENLSVTEVSENVKFQGQT